MFAIAARPTDKRPTHTARSACPYQLDRVLRRKVRNGHLQVAPVTLTGWLKYVEGCVHCHATGTSTWRAGEVEVRVGSGGWACRHQVVEV